MIAIGNNYGIVYIHTFAHSHTHTLQNCKRNDGMSGMNGSKRMLYVKQGCYYVDFPGVSDSLRDKTRNILTIDESTI